MNRALVRSVRRRSAAWTAITLSTLSLLSAACVVEGGAAAGGVVVSGPPPQPVRELPPPPPPPMIGAFWVPGYWHWTGLQYSWIPGHWESAPAGSLWRAPRYSVREGTYFYEPGGWTHR